MCEVCDEIKGLRPELALKIIATKMLVGSRNSHLSKVIDSLLGTSVEEEIDEEQEKTAFSAMLARRTPPGD
jgi:hypothetical protein